MNVRTLLAVSLTLAFASATAFAQDATPAAEPAPVDQAAAAPAATSDTKPMHPKHHARHHAMHHRHGHGHVPGDPAVIDHSADHLIVTPTATKLNVPTGGH